MSIAIHSATVDDQDAIVALVRSERLKPVGLKWSNFVVAADAGQLVGAAQMRKHKDGSRELGSLVVVRRWRGRVFIITGQVRTAYFARWGFRPIETAQAPAAIRFNYYAGQVGGGLISVLRGRALNRLTILDRMPCESQNENAAGPPLAQGSPPHRPIG